LRPTGTIRTGKRIEPQVLLDERRQAIQPLAEINRLCRHENPYATAGDDHVRPRRLLSAAATVRGSAAP